MPIRITLTVETDNHGGSIEFTDTYEGLDGNPRFDGDVVRRRATVMVERVVKHLDQLVDLPLRE
jgi:hypothetical protein